MRHLLGFAVLVLSPVACIFDSERRAAVDVNSRIVSSYVFRGQTMTDRAVAQVASAIQLPTADGAHGRVGTWGNLDLGDSVGDAWFDGGHGGEFTQIDLIAGYERRVGAVDLALGLRYYDWPNGDSFPFSPFPSTSEVFAQVATDSFGLRPSLTVHYDIDEVESLYAQAALVREFAVAKSVRCELHAWLGWSDDRHSRWLYRTAVDAFADLGAECVVSIDLDPVTTLQFVVAGSTIVDDALRSWFDGRVDPDVGWIGAGIAWSF